MTDDDSQLLSAYLDGELSGEQANALKKRLLQEPALRRELEALRHTDEQLVAFASRMDERPLSKQVVDMLRPRRSATGFWAMAAGVLVAIGLITLQVTSRSESALETAQSGEQFLHQGQRFEVVASFRTREGQICREIAGESSSSIVCRGAEGWVTRLEVKADQVPDGHYQPAGAGVGEIDRFIREHMVGSTLTRKEEKALIESGWSESAR